MRAENSGRSPLYNPARWKRLLVLHLPGMSKQLKLLGMRRGVVTLGE